MLLETSEIADAGSKIRLIEPSSSAAKVESAEDVFTDLLCQRIVCSQSSHSLFVLHSPVAPLLLLLKSLDFLHGVLILPLNALSLRNSILLGSEQVAPLLVPLGPASLVSHDQVSLLGINSLALLLEVVVLLLEQLLLSFKLPPELLDLLLSFLLDGFIFIPESVPLLGDSYHLLFEASLLAHHALRADLKLLGQRLLVLFQSLDLLIQLLHLTCSALGRFLHFLAELGFQLTKDGLMLAFLAGLALSLRLLELLDSLLELLVSLLVVPLGLLLLLLQEFEFAFPECLLFFELALEIGVLSFHLVVLALPVFNLLSDAFFAVRDSLIELFILRSQLHILALQGANELLLLPLKVLMSLTLHSLLPLKVGIGLLDDLFELLVRLPLLLVLGLDVLLFLLDSGDPLLEDLLLLLFLGLQSFLVSLDGLLQLIVELLDPLLLERQFLFLESLFSLEIDLALSQLIHRVVVLLL